MRQITWNCQGLGNGPTVRSLLNIQKEDPDILFLSETKMEENKVKGFRWKLGMINCFTKDCDGRSGGLALFWKNGVDLHVRAVSRLYIDVDVTENDGFIWWFMGFYGEPSSDKKDLSWHALRVLNAARRRPWI